MVLGRWSVLCGILICYSLPPTIFLRIPSPEHKLAPIWTRQMNRSNAKPSFSGVLLLRETDDTAHVFMCCIYIYTYIFVYLVIYLVISLNNVMFYLFNWETKPTQLSSSKTLSNPTLDPSGKKGRQWTLRPKIVKFA